MPVLMARQPVLDAKLQTWGYELLFRGGTENAFRSQDGGVPNGETATLSVLDSAFFSGAMQMTAGHKMLVNFTRQLLLGGYAEILPKESVIIEILETVTPDREVIDACYSLKNAGYSLALDDFTYSPQMDDLIAVADFIKVDFMQSGPRERVELAETLLPMNVKLLAEKVETQEDFEQARDLGYTYFQGYFFSKPQLVPGARLPESRVARMQLLREVNRPEIDIDKIVSVIKNDPGLTMRLLRYLNSAFFGFRSKITSIRQAVVMLGRSNLRKWATVLAIADNAPGKPPELLKQALFRARFCELIAELGKQIRNCDDFFITGLLSLVDALLDMPRDQIITQMSLNEEMGKILLNESSGSLLCDTLHLAENVECGQWALVEKIARSYNISQEVVAHAYREAALMADNFVKIQSS